MMALQRLVVGHFVADIAKYSTTFNWKYLEELDGTYTNPTVHTTIPGPQSQQLFNSLGQVQLTSSIQLFTDYDRSQGNYMVDADGNIILDLFQQYSTLALGYNNPTILKAVANASNLSLLASRPALGFSPSVNYFEQLQSSLLSVKPFGMNWLVHMMCGACSVENALKLAFMWYMKNQRGGREISDEEIQSAINNQIPGCPKISVLSFRGAFHGRTMACLSITHSKAMIKVDIPVFDGPIAPFPALQYPLEEFSKENKTEEERCLAQVEDLIHQYKEIAPVAVVIIEPIQSEGGDNHASAEFFKGLQQICHKYGIVFVVDEVQTGGGATGQFWAHETWGLPTPPHLVTFAKKLQASGVFAIDGMLPTEPYRIFNTWMGDPSKLPILQAIIEEIKREKLLELVRTSGQVLLSGLRDLERQYSPLIHNTRGIGTFCAFNIKDSPTRDIVNNKLREKGVMVGSCGSVSIRLRPALIFQPRHAHVFLNICEDVLKELYYN